MRTLRNILILLILYLFPEPAWCEHPRICLTMIVKNEEQIIVRCLESVKSIVDCISVCDTGSSDNTVQLIEDYLLKNNIPGKIHKHEWKNFGANRSFSFEAAQATLEEFGFPLNSTYLLFLDADMLLKIGAGFSKDYLTDDCYTIYQKNNEHICSNIRLVRASLPWFCIGATYEYWSCKRLCKQSHLNSISIDDRDDGGCKADKFERDIKLLTHGLTQEPENARYMFYLAQSYKGMNRFEEAIKWYKERILRGGWNEEVWYAKWMIGKCFESMDNWNEALAYYLDAYQFLPERAEPLQRISEHYRLNQQHYLAYLFASLGSEIPFPQNHALYISYPVYEYLLDEDISVSAFYTHYKKEGFEAANRLMLKKQIPNYVKDQAYRNMLYYIENVKNARFRPIEIDPPPIREGLATRYNPMNTSIQKKDFGYELICRTVNYIQIDAKHFKSLDLLDPSNTARSRNFLLQYDKNFKWLAQQEIIEDLPRIRRKGMNVEGLEDCRMFTYKNSTWFTCTTLDTHPCGQPQISLCKLADNRFNSTVEVEMLIPLFGPDPNRCEKNWMPYVKNDKINLIYSCDPYIVYEPEIDMENGTSTRMAIRRDDNLKHDFSRFYGSASPIEFDDGYLMLIHETVYDDMQRNDTHRLVFLDQNFKFKMLSMPFTFLHKGVEYCCGMTIDHSERNLLLTLGIEDREAYLCSIDLDEVRSLLRSLD